MWSQILLGNYGVDDSSSPRLTIQPSAIKIKDHARTDRNLQFLPYTSGQDH